MRFQRGLEQAHQILEVREDRVIIIARCVGAIRQVNPSIDGILSGGRSGLFDVFIVISVHEPQEGSVIVSAYLLDGVKLIIRFISVVGEALIIHTEHDMG